MNILLFVVTRSSVGSIYFMTFRQQHNTEEAALVAIEAAVYSAVEDPEIQDPSSLRHQSMALCMEVR